MCSGIYPFRIMVVGMTQTGKTFWVRNSLLPVLRNDGYRYIVYDPDEEFDKESGYVTSNHEKMKEYIEKKKWVIYRPKTAEIDNVKEGLKVFSDIVKTVFNWAEEQIRNGKKSKIFFVVDELATITLADSKRPKNPPQLTALIKRGMKRGIGFCATTQNLQDADTNIISQSQVVVIFDCLPLDIKYIEKKLPIRLPVIKRNGASALDLKEYEFIVYNHAHRKMYKQRLRKGEKNTKWSV